MASDDIHEDLCQGASEIADFLFGSSAEKKQADANRRKAYHLIANHGLPVFRLGSTVCARKSTLLAYIEEQERAARTRTPGRRAA